MADRHYLTRANGNALLWQISEYWSISTLNGYTKQAVLNGIVFRTQVAGIARFEPVCLLDSQPNPRGPPLAS